jgi:hypothetical protein
MIRSGDYSQKLVDYLKRNLSKGYDLESLRWALVSQGYSRVQVEKAMGIVKEQMLQSVPKAAEPAKITAVEEPTVVVEPEKKSIWQRLFG